MSHYRVYYLRKNVHRMMTQFHSGLTWGKNIFPFLHKNKESNSKLIIFRSDTELLSTSSFFWNSKRRLDTDLNSAKQTYWYFSRYIFGLSVWIVLPRGYLSFGPKDHMTVEVYLVQNFMSLFQKRNKRNNISTAPHF